MKTRYKLAYGISVIAAAVAIGFVLFLVDCVSTG
jgi:hypothetical protein